MDTLEIARKIVGALEEKKAENIILMDIRGQAVFADFFVICTGTSDRMLHALGEAVDEAVKITYNINTRLEGTADDGWVLADCGDVIVHLFSPDRRDYYRIEELWSGGRILLHLQ